ncbi:hypothetical protein MYX78_13590, partial [Acidobacteria bacterium AH-259-G07]|nr:hypothetical protein [Acidobacteria bacterium AH-259-G07]
AEDSNYLAAARSSDDGYTWTNPTSIGAFSVTPHLLALDNGMVAVLYGRPGLHIRASTDSGQTWSESIPLVGPPEAELGIEELQEALDATLNIGVEKFTCANTDIVVTGPDRVLVAYSDFQYKDRHGVRRKAIKVREVIVTPPAMSN